MLIFTAIRHLSMSKKFVTKQEWLIHTARDREREWDREQDQERWVYVFCYVLFTLHRDRDREWERGTLGFCCDIGQTCIGQDVKMTYFLE